MRPVAATRVVDEGRPADAGRRCYQVVCNEFERPVGWGARTVVVPAGLGPQAVEEFAGPADGLPGPFQDLGRLRLEFGDPHGQFVEFGPGRGAHRGGGGNGEQEAPSDPGGR